MVALFISACFGTRGQAHDEMEQICSRIGLPIQNLPHVAGCLDPFMFKTSSLIPRSNRF